jgi:hypothetical protein
MQNLIMLSGILLNVNFTNVLMLILLCRMSFVIFLNVIMMSAIILKVVLFNIYIPYVFTLNSVMLNAIMSNVVSLIVMGPERRTLFNLFV